MSETSRRRYDLTSTERRAYELDGFFVRTRVFSEDELADLREAAECVVRRAEQAVSGREGYRVDSNRYIEAAGATVQYEHQPGSTTVRVIEPFHHLDGRFDALVDDPRLVDPMCGVVGSDGVALWTDKINLKRPREGSRFRWHQDSPYWAHACRHLDQLPNVMVTLDDASRINGCFRVIRGSHRQGLLPGVSDGTMMGPLFTDPDQFDESHEVLAEAPAGSLVFFSPHTVHGSQPNRSDSPRRALVLTYQPADFPMFKLPETRNAGPEARAA